MNTGVNSVNQASTSTADSFSLKAVLDLTNNERKAAGLKSVQPSDDLNRLAQLRAAEIAEK